MSRPIFSETSFLLISELFRNKPKKAARTASAQSTGKLHVDLIGTTPNLAAHKPTSGQTQNVPHERVKIITDRTAPVAVQVRFRHAPRTRRMGRMHEKGTNLRPWRFVHTAARTCALFPGPQGTIFPGSLTFRGLLQWRRHFPRTADLASYLPHSTCMATPVSTTHSDSCVNTFQIDI